MPGIRPAPRWEAYSAPQTRAGFGEGRRAVKGGEGKERKGRKRGGSRGDGKGEGRTLQSKILSTALSAVASLLELFITLYRDCVI